MKNKIKITIFGESSTPYHTESGLVETTTPYVKTTINVSNESLLLQDKTIWKENDEWKMILEKVKNKVDFNIECITSGWYGSKKKGYIIGLI